MPQQQTNTIRLIFEAVEEGDPKEGLFPLEKAKAFFSIHGDSVTISFDANVNGPPLQPFPNFEYYTDTSLRVVFNLSREDFESRPGNQLQAPKSPDNAPGVFTFFYCIEWHDLDDNRAQILEQDGNRIHVSLSGIPEGGGVLEVYVDAWFELSEETWAPPQPAEIPNADAAKEFESAYRNLYPFQTMSPEEYVAKVGFAHHWWNLGRRRASHQESPLVTWLRRVEEILDDRDKREACLNRRQ